MRYNVTADHEPTASPRDLDADVDALQDLHAAILERPDRSRSYVLTVDAPDAWTAAEEVRDRLASLGVAPCGLAALEVLTTEAFDTREAAA